MKNIKRILGFGKSNFQECVINPSLAKKLLAFNKENRKEKPRHTQWLASQMTQGLWKYNGDTIRFKKDGTLADGQHRLNAIIQSNTSQKFLVVVGLEENIMSTIDTGMIRGAHDVLELNGFKYSSLMASTIKAILKARGNNFSNNGMRGNSSELISNEVVLDFARKHRAVLEKVCSKGSALSVEFKLLTPTFYAANYYNLHLNNELKANQFFKVLTEGTGLTKEDAIYHFRKKLIDAKIANLKMNNKAKYFYLYTCWESFLKKKKVNKLPVFKASSKVPVLN